MIDANLCDCWDDSCTTGRAHHKPRSILPVDNYNGRHRRGRSLAGRDHVGSTRRQSVGVGETGRGEVVHDVVVDYARLSARVSSSEPVVDRRGESNRVAVRIDDGYVSLKNNNQKLQFQLFEEFETKIEVATTCANLVLIRDWAVEWTRKCSIGFDFFDYLRYVLVAENLLIELLFFRKKILNFKFTLITFK